jgi:neutral trehalase
VLAAVAAVYGMVYADVWLRARSAYLEGERCLEWDGHPELKAAYFDGLLAERQERLEAERAADRITSKELEERLALAIFERDAAMKESSLKYAYAWFQTAVELFSPPESRWVIRSRLKMAVAKELWKKELDAKKISYQDYMLK